MERTIFVFQHESAKDGSLDDSHSGSWAGLGRTDGRNQPKMREDSSSSRINQQMSCQYLPRQMVRIVKDTR